LTVFTPFEINQKLSLDLWFLIAYLSYSKNNSDSKSHSLTSTLFAEGKNLRKGSSTSQYGDLNKWKKSNAVFATSFCAFPIECSLNITV
jgi:hypothetical protein